MPTKRGKTSKGRASKRQKKEDVEEAKSSPTASALDERQMENLRQNSVQPKYPLGTPGADPRWVVCQTEDIKKHYNMLEPIGTPGSYGYAKKVERKGSGQKYACKVINKKKYGIEVQLTNTEPTVHTKPKQKKRSSERSTREMSEVGSLMQSLRNELNFLQNLSHPNIIDFVDVFEDRVNVYIVMELCQGRELFDRISEKQRYSEKDAYSVVKQLFEGVRYMHQFNIGHYDLKPENCMFVSEDEDSLLKIIDFGMAQEQKSRKAGKYLRNQCGTLSYTAPECLKQKYDKASDMWSLGCILFTMLIGFPPFFGNTPDIIKQKVATGFSAQVKSGYGAWFPQTRPVSELARSLIGKLLSPGADRLTAEEAMQHPWLANKGKNLSSAPLAPAVLSGLKGLGSMTHFKETMLRVLVDNIPEGERKEVSAAFAEMDKDGDGVLTKEEIRQVFANWRQRSSSSPAKHSNSSSSSSKEAHSAVVSSFGDEPALQQLLEAVDIDKDGCVSYEELLMASQHRKLLSKEERLWQLFQKCDKNGDGNVEAKELVDTLGMDTKTAKKLIESADQDGDGQLSYDEFLDAWYEVNPLSDPNSV